MPKEFTPERRWSHCAVSLEHFVLIFGGYSWNARDKLSTRVIWSYNLYTEVWRKYEMPFIRCAPESFEGSVAAAIDKIIYIFGGYSIEYSKYMNSLWNLSRTNEGCFTWSSNKPQCKEKSPSPRQGHTGWEYAGKLWIFAGFGDSPEGYLNDNGIETIVFERLVINNQLLCFDPNTEKWTNPQCLGSIPTPRSDHASAIINDNVWLFGGTNQDMDYLGDICQLQMSSLTWSQIPTAHYHPHACSHCTLTAVADDKLVLHGGFTGDQTRQNIMLNDIWIMDLTSHSWRLFTSRKDIRWSFHTGSTGLNNSIIIIGGMKSCLDRYAMFNNVFNVMLTPKSLQQVAMQAIFKYQNELPLNCLPRKLLSLLDVSVKDQNVGSESV